MSVIEKKERLAGESDDPWFVRMKIERCLPFGGVMAVFV